MAVMTCSQDDGYYSTATKRMTKKRKMQHLCQRSFLTMRITILKYKIKRYSGKKMAENWDRAVSILGRV
jgi:hypothetical protein